MRTDASALPALLVVALLGGAAAAQETLPREAGDDGGAIETDVLVERRKSAAAEYDLPLDQALEHVMFEEWKMPVATRAVGRPEDVADLMAFALSDRAAYMTGATINIDGGTDF